MTNLNELFLQHVLSSFDKQFVLYNMIHALSWQCDLREQSLTFGSKYRFNMQVIGTQSTSANTWMWGWANRLSVPVATARASEELLALGRRENIPEFTQSILPITEDINGDKLMLIASGICNGNAYYRGPYDGGAVFMLIRDLDFPRETVNPAIRIPVVFCQASMAVTISDHKVAFRHYVHYYQGNAEETDDTIRAEFDNGSRIEAKFEPHCHNRMSSMRAFVK
ncbi:hypothetical protein BGZ72_006328 [Mortierella alpina]|nr:hypothetical protein BGZ72_006328 [Mortierella alpina]